MRVKSKIVSVSFAVTALLLTCFAIGCQTKRPQGTTPVALSEAEAAHTAYLLRVHTAKAFPDTLPDAAHLTYAAYVRAVNAGETAPSETIPPLYWAKRIKQLKPVRVYTHRVNIVVVQSVSNNVESGKYIYIPVSSYLPMNGDDGFVFNPNPKKGKTYRVHEVLDFTRPTGN